MKNKFLEIFKITLLLFIFTKTYASHNDICKNLFDEHGNATLGLTNLLAITEARINGPKNILNVCYSPDVKEWRDHPGTERWNLTLKNNLKNKDLNIIKICENELGIKGTVLPKKVKYSGILFLGASFNSVLNRVEFYNKLIKGNIIDKELKIWILTGKRDLDEKAGETKKNFLELVPAGQKPLPLPPDEQSMIKFIFHYKIPKETKVEYIYSEKELNHTRATTASTVYAWAAKIPNPPHKTYYLGISNQPYVTYQESVINLTLQEASKKNIEVHVIGEEERPREDTNNYAAILLDTISKIISNCNKLFLLNRNSHSIPSVEL